MKRTPHQHILDERALSKAEAYYDICVNSDNDEYYALYVERAQLALDEAREAFEASYKSYIES